MQALLRGSGLERKYRGWLGRQFNYGALFRQSEAELAELNEEFYPFWDAAQRKLQPAWGAEAPAAQGIGGWIQPACFFSIDCRCISGRQTLLARQAY